VPSNQKPLLVFSHGNSFPASTYGELTQHLTGRGYAVEAIEKLGHDPAYPVSNNWLNLVLQIANFATEQALLHPERPVFLLGHSLGGFLSLMCAAQYPLLRDIPIRGVILLDSPVIGGWRAGILRTVKAARLIDSFSPGAVSRKRQTTWLNTHAAFLHFRAKKNFALWDDAAIYRYVESFNTNLQGHRQLSFDRKIETAIYNTLPDNLEALLTSKPPQCPVAFIGGLQSIEVKKVGLKLTKKITQGRINMVTGSHLFPIENPLVTAAAIHAEILNIAALT
jgi:pimeloyl-ACP methyl ester carboxylesterase